MNWIKHYWRTLSSTMFGRNCYSVLSPIVFLTRIFGIFPLSLEGPVGKKKYSTSYASLMYSTVFHVSTIVGLVVWTKNTSAILHGSAHVTILRIHIDVRLVVELFSIIVLSASIILAKEKIANTVNNICAQDEALRNLGIRFDYAADFRRSCIRLGIIISINSAICIYDFVYLLEFNSRYPLHWIGWMLPNVVRTMSTYLFADVIIVLKQKLRGLNKYLEKMIQDSENSPLKNISMRSEPCNKIRLIATIHRNLCNSASTLNQFIGPNIVTSVIFALFITTFSTYFAIQEFNNPNGTYSRIYGLLNWGMVSYIHIIYIVLICQTTQNEGKLTGKLIHKLNVRQVDSAINMAIESFSLQLDHRKIEFSGAGLFPLDASLIGSIVGAVTTYLVIVLQMETTK